MEIKEKYLANNRKEIYNNYIKQYPEGIFAVEAFAQIKSITKTDDAFFKKNQKQGAIAAYYDYLDNGTSIENKKKIAMLAVKLIAAEKNKFQLYKEFADKYPEESKYLPGKYATMFVGPEGAKVYQLRKFIEGGKSNKLIFSIISTSY